MTKVLISGESSQQALDDAEKLFDYVKIRNSHQWWDYKYTFNDDKPTYENKGK